MVQVEYIIVKSSIQRLLSDATIIEHSDWKLHKDSLLRKFHGIIIILVSRIMRVCELSMIVEI